MKTIKLLTLLAFLFLLSTPAKAQVRYNSGQQDFWQNVRFGGGLGLGFGNGWFSGTLAPSAIYQVNSQFATGLGLNFSYADQKDVYTATILGGSVIGLYNPIPEIQVSGEFEELHVNRKFEYIGDNVRDQYWVPALFFGLGYSTRNVTFGIKYDVLHDEDKSFYADAFIPFVRVYF
ncbi:alpha-ketoglutarate decarboxylase [Zhouia amylolytica]|uniref:Alpha-ketoglutarate decarboxylase n=1 Tax=Zhouia amylolytica AD3 TaxID=1286632 RepID=W2ULX7_9FLAO|nr:alpha-ketoglutarate decarboxylase [Zhouia amylolytica]ETN94451.1 hypothetical protein P278_23940 [Zhouia amylolytica AD3]